MAKPAPASTKTASKSSATEKTAIAVSANPRLVAAIRSFDESMSTTKSLLVEIGEIAQQESLTKNEVVASLMAARGIEKVSAESQYSRMKKLMTDPETLEKIKNGEMTLNEARAATAKKQKNPSEKVKQENANKRLTKAIGTIITAAKEIGIDLKSILNTLSAAAKKAGIK